MPQPGVPESFKVLVKELQSLCLDIKVLDENGQEIELKEDDDDDYQGYVDDSVYSAGDDEIVASGYTIEDVEDEGSIFDDDDDESDPFDDADDFNDEEDE